MNYPQPIATIQDLSTFGRCSLSVVIPTISALGIQCCPIPTAVFSTHTGGLGDVTKRDLSDFISPVLEHYKKLELGFSAIYTGYLGSESQFENCYNFFDTYPDAIHMVDPVMGDHGKAYKAYTPLMQSYMKELISKADIITPNLTEAAILLGIDYPENPLELTEVHNILVELKTLAKGDIVITGLRIKDNANLINGCYDSKEDKFFAVSVSPIPASYPGTGDLFASVLVGSLVKNKSLADSVSLATSFTALAVDTTYKAGTDSRYGVLLEQVLSGLITGETGFNTEIFDL